MNKLLQRGRSTPVATIEQRIQAAGLTRGFDYLRIGLAVGVLLWHSVYVSGSAEAQDIVLGGYPGIAKAMILPMFFALSGFLVAGSLARARTLEGFVTLRVIRIMPALAVEVLLSALILGPILATLPLADYFMDGRFWTYLLNIAGYIHYVLPAVFADNPRPDIVNLSLWTVPYELECYVTLIVVAVLGLHRHRGWFVAATVSLNLLLAVYYMASGGPASAATMTVPGRGLVVCFLAGVAIFLFRDRLPWSGWLALVATAVGAACLSRPETMMLAAFPMAYATIYLGLLNPPPLPLVTSGDYSYGIYLFSYPIQQTLASAEFFRPWWMNMPAALTLSLLYAVFSWHCVEKPVLGQRRRIVEMVERLGRGVRPVFGRMRCFGIGDATARLPRLLRDVTDPGALPGWLCGATGPRPPIRGPGRRAAMINPRRPGR